jgi:hypothetical protein
VSARAARSFSPCRGEFPVDDRVATRRAGARIPYQNMRENRSHSLMEVYMRTKPLALILGAALFAAACDDKDLVNVITDGFLGTFSLQSANGNALPAVVADSVSPPLRIEVLSGSLVLRADRTFDDVVDFRNTLGGIVSTSQTACSGTYTIDGREITFTETGTAPCNQVFVGTLDAGTISASIRGVAYVFIR